MQRLEKIIAEIDTLFKQADKYKAHQKAQPLLKELGEPLMLQAILEKNLTEPTFFNQKRINPVIRFLVAETPNCSIMVHVWMPLPDRDTQKTHQSVHHHGKLLLSSYAAFGTGYRSILFKNGYQVEPKTRITHMQIEKEYQNNLGNLEFVDVDTPHVVFYPSDLSITIVLWSPDKENVASKAKQLGIVQRFKKPLRKCIELLGISKMLGLNVIENFDFYPDNGKLIQMQSRVMYPVNTTENLIQNVFYICQRLDYQNERVLRELAKNPSLMPWITKYLKGETISDIFAANQLNIDKINFTRAELMKCFS